MRALVPRLFAAVSAHAQTCPHRSTVRAVRRICCVNLHGWCCCSYCSSTSIPVRVRPRGAKIRSGSAQTRPTGDGRDQSELRLTLPPGPRPFQALAIPPAVLAGARNETGDSDNNHGGTTMNDTQLTAEKRPARVAIIDCCAGACRSRHSHLRARVLVLIVTLHGVYFLVAAAARCPGASAATAGCSGFRPCLLYGTCLWYSSALRHWTQQRRQSVPVCSAAAR